MSLPQSSSQRKTNLDDIQCAVLTGTGRSAIAVIGLRGPGASSIIERCFAAATPPALLIGQVRYGNWTGSDAATAARESVVITPIGDDQFEIHCHGGSAAIARIVGDLLSFGAIQIENADWSEVDNLLIREARQVLARCLTTRTAAIAMDQVRGTLVDWVRASIDHPTDPTRLAKEAERIVAHAPLTTRLTDPFRVVLVGPPNVGKSSLVNAMVGYDRSITFDQAGTTRDVLHADTVIDGIPIRLSDTAGIRESDEDIERQGVARAIVAAKNADLVLRVSSPDDKTASELPSLRAVGHRSGEKACDRQPGDDESATIHIFNKIDLLSRDQSPPADAVPTNAVTGDGIPGLLKMIADHLGRSMPDSGQPVPLTTRQADLLRKLAEADSPAKMRQTLVQLLGG